MTILTQVQHRIIHYNVNELKKRSEETPVEFLPFMNLKSFNSSCCFLILLVGSAEGRLWCMVAYTKPQQRKKEESEQLRG